MFSLLFWGSKFFINLRWKFRVRRILQDMQSYHFGFKITILKLGNIFYNLGHNILKPYKILVQVQFTKSKNKT